MTDAERLALVLQQNRSVPMATPTGEFIPTPPLNKPTQVNPYNPIGLGETALSLGTGAIAAPLAGWYGAGTELFGGDGKAAAGKLADALTYKPTTDYGQASASAFSDFADKTGISSLPPVVSGISTPRLGAGATRYAGQQYGVPMLEKSLTMYEQGKLTPGFKPVAGMEAWHGTPHEIVGNFDLAKVGTGEGAQAKGYGMYYGQARGTGETYQKNLSDFTWTVDGKPYDTENAAHRAAIEFKISGGNVNKDEIIKRYERNIAELEARGADWANSSAFQKRQELEVIKTGKLPNVEEKSLGNLYKVDIPDEQIPLMLNWDETLNKQPQAVKDAFSKLGISVDEKANKAFLDDLEAQLTGGAVKGVKEVPNPTGESLYNKLVSKFGSPEAASRELNKLGVSGIRYLDEGSRMPARYTGDSAYTNAGQSFKESGFTIEDALSGMKKAYKNADETELKQALSVVYGKMPNPTSNFVVFKPETVKILEKNDVPVTRKELLQQEFDKLDK
jgi:hypothetical protein